MRKTEGSSEEFYYPKDGHKACFEIEENSFWFRERNSVIEYLVKKFKSTGTVADVGGGNGFVTLLLIRIFGEMNTTLIEPGVDGCKNAKVRGVKNVFNGSIENYSGESFDNICLFDVIEHIEDPEIFIKSCCDQLKSKGKLFITVPAHNFLMSDDDVEGGHFMRYSKRDIRKLVATQENLKIIFSSYFFLCLIPFIFFIKSLPYRIGAGKKAQAVDHHKSSFSSKLLGFLLKIEFYLLFKTRIIPTGASLICCIEKK